MSSSVVWQRQQYFSHSQSLSDLSHCAQRYFPALVPVDIDSPLGPYCSARKESRERHLSNRLPATGAAQRRLISQSIPEESPLPYNSEQCPSNIFWMERKSSR